MIMAARRSIIACLVRIHNGLLRLSVNDAFKPMQCSLFSSTIRRFSSFHPIDLTLRDLHSSTTVNSPTVTGITKPSQCNIPSALHSILPDERKKWENAPLIRSRDEKKTVEKEPVQHHPQHIVDLFHKLAQNNAYKDQTNWTELRVEDYKDMTDYCEDRDTIKQYGFEVSDNIRAIVAERVLDILKWPMNCARRSLRRELGIDPPLPNGASDFDFPCERCGEIGDNCECF